MTFKKKHVHHRCHRCTAVGRGRLRVSRHRQGDTTVGEDGGFAKCTGRPQLQAWVWTAPETSGQHARCTNEGPEASGTASQVAPGDLATDALVSGSLSWARLLDFVRLHLRDLRQAWLCPPTKRMSHGSHPMLRRVVVVGSRAGRVEAFPRARTAGVAFGTGQCANRCPHQCRRRYVLTYVGGAAQGHPVASGRMLGLLAMRSRQRKVEASGRRADACLNKTRAFSREHLGSLSVDVAVIGARVEVRRLKRARIRAARSEVNTELAFRLGPGGRVYPRPQESNPPRRRPPQSVRALGAPPQASCPDACAARLAGAMALVPLCLRPSSGNHWHFAGPVHIYSSLSFNL